MPRPEASAIEATVKPSGSLCRKTAKKTSRPRGTETRKPEAIDTPSKKVWIERPNEGREADRRVHHLLAVDLLAEVEVGSHGVLEEVDQEEAREQQERRVRRAYHRLGDHLEADGGEHEARSQGDEGLEDDVVPAPAGDDGQASEDVGESGRGPEDQAPGLRGQGEPRSPDRRYASMAAAALRPAPIARMTVAPPVTMSPPAKTPGLDVRIVSGSTSM